MRCRPASAKACDSATIGAPGSAAGPRRSAPGPGAWPARARAALLPLADPARHLGPRRSAAADSTSGSFRPEPTERLQLVRAARPRQPRQVESGEIRDRQAARLLRKEALVFRERIHEELAAARRDVALRRVLLAGGDHHVVHVVDDVRDVHERQPTGEGACPRPSRGASACSLGGPARRPARPARRGAASGRIRRHRCRKRRRPDTRRTSRARTASRRRRP